MARAKGLTKRPTRRTEINRKKRERAASLEAELALLTPPSEIIRRYAKEWKTSEAYVRDRLDEAYANLAALADREEKREERAQMLLAYQALYHKAYKTGHISAAKGILDSICKLRGLLEPDEINLNVQHHHELAMMGHTTVEDMREHMKRLAAEVPILGPVIDLPLLPVKEDDA